MEHAARRLRAVPERKGDRPCLWVHGVSVGEVASARHLLDRLAAEFPNWDVALSATTRAGLEVAQQHFPGRLVFSYPFDLSFLVRRAFARIRPQLVIIVEHELWPNFLGHAQARGVPVVIVNGRLSERSLRGYRLLSRLLTWPPPGVVRICVEDETSAEGFRRLGVPGNRIWVTGNLKFDSALHTRRAPGEGFERRDSEWVLVGASTHRGEEMILLDCLEAVAREGNGAGTRLILAPRRVERAGEIERLVRRRGFGVARWSQVSRNGTGGGRRPEVVIVDTIGDLHEITLLGDVVFVGGSLVPFGGHNVIEPASLGRPVVIGPHYRNFRQVVSTFLARDALLVASGEKDLAAKLRDLRRDPDRARNLGQRAGETVARNAGASERTMEVIRPVLEALAAGRPVPPPA